jgi:hypothetical protein
MTCEAGHEGHTAKIGSVDFVDHPNHRARGLLSRGFNGVISPAETTVVEMAINAVDTRCAGYHAHRVHELINRHIAEKRDVFKHIPCQGRRFRLSLAAGPAANRHKQPQTEG